MMNCYGWHYQRVFEGSSSELFLKSFSLIPHLQFIHSPTSLTTMEHLDFENVQNKSFRKM